MASNFLVRAVHVGSPSRCLKDPCIPAIKPSFKMIMLKSLHHLSSLQTPSRSDISRLQHIHKGEGPDQWAELSLHPILTLPDQRLTEPIRPWRKRQIPSAHLPNADLLHRDGRPVAYHVLQLQRPHRRHDTINTEQTAPFALDPVTVSFRWNNPLNRSVLSASVPVIGKSSGHNSPR